MTATARTPKPARSRRRRLLRVLSTVLIVVGALAVADAVVTVLWREPISSIYASVEQGRLDRRFDALEHVTPTPVQRKALAALPDPSRKIAYAARAFARTSRNGSAVGRLKIPRMHLSKVVVAGTDTGDLQRGPGHYPATPLPGERGTVGIAGHRTTYGAPFRHIDRLRPGDSIEVDMPYGRFSYRVERTRIVKPSALWVTQRVSYDRLILSACHPLYSAAKRIVVFARLVKATPRGIAAA